MVNLTGEPGAGTSTAQATEGNGTATAKTFSQEDVDRIVQKEKRDWDKQASDWKTKAKAFDENQKTQKDKELADLAEVDRLKKLLGESEPYKSKYEAYETAVGEILKVKLEAIPQEKRSIIDTLPESLSPLERLRFIEANSALLLGGGATSAGVPGGGKFPSGKSDALLADAEERIKRIRPDLQVDSQQYKDAVQRAYTELKAASPALN